jgi:hypothetical protein
MGADDFIRGLSRGLAISGLFPYPFSPASTCAWRTARRVVLSDMSVASAKPPPPTSPISQLLQSIGMTRDDLNRHADQMREYLGNNAALPDNPHTSLPAFTRDSSESRTLQPSEHLNRTLSRANSGVDTFVRVPSPPSTPVKAEPVDAVIPARMVDSMEMVMERKARQAKKEKRARKEKERNPPMPPSPTPVHSTVSMDSFMGPGPGRRVSLSKGSANASGATLEASDA